MTHPPPKIESVPLVVGPVRGYRYWHAEWEGGQPVLRSLYHTTIWPAEGPLHASCAKRPGSLVAWIRRRFSSQAEETHRAPGSLCECGIYALNCFESIESRELLPPVSHTGLDVYVLGVVLLWGRVVQHERGYRAEYARPLRLLATAPLARAIGVHPLLDAVAARYGIPLVSKVGALAAA